MFRCLILFFLSPIFLVGELSYPDFELLMDLDRYKTVQYFSEEDKKELKFYENDYLEKIPLLLTQKGERKIPRTVHFIWVGPKEFPKESIKNVESWKKHHPEWVVKFWTDDETRALPVEGMEKHLVSSFDWKFLSELYPKTDNWGEKSDLLRYEILYKEGGIYVDHDIECFRSFDLLSCYDFYICLEPPHYNPGISTAIFPTNGLIASSVNHPILKEAMSKVLQGWADVEKKFPGPNFTFVRVLNRTFISFLKAVREEVQNCKQSIVLPATFLYPSPNFTKEEKEGRVARGLCFGSHKYAGAWR